MSEHAQGGAAPSDVSPSDGHAFCRYRALCSPSLAGRDLLEATSNTSQGRSTLPGVLESRARGRPHLAHLIQKQTAAIDEQSGVPGGLASPSMTTKRGQDGCCAGLPSTRGLELPSGWDRHRSCQGSGRRDCRPPARRWRCSWVGARSCQRERRHGNRLAAGPGGTQAALARPVR